MEENSLDLGSVKEIIVENFENWTSGNEIINNFIQEKQLKYDIYGTVFEWIPYSELFDIKKIGNKRLAIAIWKEGPLHYDKDENKLIRKSSEKVVLRYLHNSRDDSIEEIANKVESYLKGSQDYALSRNLHRSYGLYQNSYQDYRLSQNLLRDYNPHRGYGLSQNLDTNDYILVFSNNYLDYYCGKCGNGYRKDTDDKQCIPCQISHLKNNWTSGNEIIDNFIQEKQSKYNKNNAVFEWIPYSELICIKETGDKCLTTAIWKEGPLHYDDEWIRSSYERVVLRCLHNSRDIVTGEIINKIKSYLEGESSQDSHIFVDSSCYGYGLSHNPDTNDYFLIFNNDYLNYYCKKCGNIYDNYNRVCKLCQINHLKNSFKSWTSKNEIIDNFIQERQLKYNETVEVFEWIPYSELFDIKEIGDKCLTTAIWKEGPLHHDKNEDELIRKSYEKVVLRYLHNPRNVLTKEIINKVESYLKEFQAQSSPYGLSQGSRQGFGLSQNSDTNDYILVFSNIYLYYYCEKCGNKYEKNMYDRLCKPCQINHLKNNFTNWTSENELIDNFIQEKQLNYNDKTGIVFEWITYSEFIDTKDIGDKCLTTAIWKEGPLFYYKSKNEWIRLPYKRVVLRYLHNSQDTITGEIINKVESYLKDGSSQNSYESYQGYGLSQIPNTDYYILVFSDIYLAYYCEKCGSKYENYDKKCNSCEMNHLKNNFINWTSKNEIINNFIQKKQLKYNETGEVFEWIPYSELFNIKAIGDKCLTTAIWREGPLHCDKSKNEWIRTSYEKVVLRYLHNSQDTITEEIMNKVESYLKNRSSQNPYQKYKNPQGYGLSQNPNTNDYILVFSSIYLNYYCEKCGNEYEYMDNKYNIFNKAGDKWSGGDFAKATWKDGPLYYNRTMRGKYKSRLPNENVLLKYPHNICNASLNEIIYSIESYGLSQNPNTKDFILVLRLKYYCEKCGEKYNNQFEIINKSCISCQTKHKVKKINDLIQEMKLNINYDLLESYTMFEWIPYNQFYDIKKIGKGGFSTVYLAIWGKGLLHYTYDSENNYRNYYSSSKLENNYKWKRESNTRVALKCLHNSQNFLDEFINEVKAYSNQKLDNILKIYGISQNPSTKDYIMVLEYAEGRNFNNYLDKNYERFDWINGLKVLTDIINGLSNIHQKQMVHCDFHIGNILFTKINTMESDKPTSYHPYNLSLLNSSSDSLLLEIPEESSDHDNDNYSAYISDMGLCKKIDDIDETSIYGVIPYVAPEVLRGKHYTQAADIYSFGMIMYVIATGRQPFVDCAHDEILVLNICNGIRPEVNEKIAPKCYIDLMKKCWDLDPDNRPNSIEIKKLIALFYSSLMSYYRYGQHNEIKKQFEETQEYRKENLLSIKNNKSTTHTQAIYASRLLNPFTKILSKYDDNIHNNTAEITDFTKL
ncbi:unnamed protein product [Rhizophagus irregularis]|nr:unnamed protein product [Rhizophagus irregularis]